MKKRIALLCILFFLLSACGSNLTSADEKGTQQSQTPLPATRIPPTYTKPSSLHLEEYPLAAAPEPVPLTFQPEGTTQEAVLAKHAPLREKV